MTGFFGALDIQEIAECPERGTHPVELTGMRTQHTQNENDFLVLDFKLEHPQFPGYQVSKWLRIYPTLTNDEYKNLDDEDKGKVTKDLNTFKEWMRSLGVPEEELGTVDPLDYTGLTGMAYGYVADRYNAEGKEWKIHSFKRE